MAWGRHSEGFRSKLNTLSVAETFIGATYQKADENEEIKTSLVSGNATPEAWRERTLISALSKWKCSKPNPTLFPQQEPKYAPSRKSEHKRRLHAQHIIMTSTIGIPIKLLNEAQVIPKSIPL